MTNIRKTSKEVTRKLTTIENSLKTKLNKFYNDRIKDNILPIESIRNKYESQVKNMIRSSVQQAYLFGTGIVTDEFTKINDNFEQFISVTDIQNIQQLTDKLNEQFWKTAGRLHRRETEFVVIADKQQVVSLAAAIIPKPLYDIAAAIIGFAAYVAYSAFNTAVTSKVQTVTEDQILLGNEQIGIDFGVDARLIFLTQEDADVDQIICAPLNRTVYDGDDPDIPDLPLHPHCRCRLLPIADVI